MGQALECDDAIRSEPAGPGGRFVLSVDGVEAELTYRLDQGRMIIDHTFTPPELRGQGIAARLMKRAVTEAEMQGWRVEPVCPYAARWFAAHPDLAGLLA